jgi:transcriptional regulator of acetoin/glycerol metabolism
MLMWAVAVAIRAVLQHANGHLGKAARELGVSRTTLWRKMKRFAISPRTEPE